MENKIVNKHLCLKILIVKPSSLGDIFHCFPAVALLGKAFPEAQFDWFVRPELEEAIAYSPVKINRTIIFPRRHLAKIKSFLPAFLKLINSLRKEKYDLIIDFQGLLRSAIFTSLSRSSQTVGFARPKEKIASLAYKHKIHIPKECIHAVDRNLALAEAITGLKASEEITSLGKTEKFIPAVEAIFKKHNITSNDKLMGMIPGARWKSKRWKAEFFAEIANKFIAKNPDYKILIIGGPDDLNSAKKIISATANKNIISIIGEMIEVINHCQFIFSNDSGPIHIAAALRKTVFALFGPTDSEKTGPYGDFHHIFQRNLSCIKCLKRTCQDASYKCHNLEISELVSTLNNYTKNGVDDENKI